MYHFLFDVHYITYIVVFPYLWAKVFIWCCHWFICLKIWKKWIYFAIFNVCHSLPIFSSMLLKRCILETRWFLPMSNFSPMVQIPRRNVMNMVVIDDNTLMTKVKLVTWRTWWQRTTIDSMTSGKGYEDKTWYKTKDFEDQSWHHKVLRT